MGSTDDPSVLARPSQRKRREALVMRGASIVALVVCVALAVVGVIVALSDYDSIAATVDGFILISIACIVAAVALRVLVETLDV